MGMHEQLGKQGPQDPVGLLGSDLSSGRQVVRVAATPTPIAIVSVQRWGCGYNVPSHWCYMHHVLMPRDMEIPERGLLLITPSQGACLLRYDVRLHHG
jgi:hypothetical protein